jgi:hypothetical protein
VTILIIYFDNIYDCGNNVRGAGVAAFHQLAVCMGVAGWLRDACVL